MVRKVEGLSLEAEKECEAIVAYLKDEALQYKLLCHDIRTANAIECLILHISDGLHRK